MGKVVAIVMSAGVLGGYFLIGFTLWGYVEAIRPKSAAKEALPHPLAFFGPSAWPTPSTGGAAVQTTPF